jgi:hypothetical protein
LLLAVAEGFCGIWVDLDQEAVCAYGSSTSAEYFD